MAKLFCGQPLRRTSQTIPKLGILTHCIVGPVWILSFVLTSGKYFRSPPATRFARKLTPPSLSLHLRSTASHTLNLFSFFCTLLHQPPSLSLALVFPLIQSQSLSTLSSPPLLSFCQLLIFPQMPIQLRVLALNINISEPRHLLHQLSLLFLSFSSIILIFQSHCRRLLASFQSLLPGKYEFSKQTEI